MNRNIYNSNSSNIPDVIFVLLIINALVFALQTLIPGVFERYLALWPIDTYRDYFSVWQLFSYGFLHGDFYHILFNMFMLWIVISIKILVTGDICTGSHVIHPLLYHVKNDNYKLNIQTPGEIVNLTISKK